MTVSMPYSCAVALNGASVVTNTCFAPSEAQVNTKQTPYLLIVLSVNVRVRGHVYLHLEIFFLQTTDTTVSHDENVE